MAKYLSTIKDLIIQVEKGYTLINKKAKEGDPEACFQIGMTHLLGIKTPIDFKKASAYFASPALKNNTEAQLLLGLIAEYVGDFSYAFQNYSKIESDDECKYMDKIIKGRKYIQAYLKKLDLPLITNKVISSILENYPKNKTSRKEASIKIAAICEDEQTCIEAAKCLYDSKEYISAIWWIKKGNVAADNPMYAAISKIFEKSITTLLKSKDMDVVDINKSSLLHAGDDNQILENVKKSCVDASTSCSKEWNVKVKKQIDTLKKKIKDSERRAYLAALAEEESKRKRRNKIIIYVVIGIVAIWLYATLSGGENTSGSDTDTDTIENNMKGDSIVPVKQKEETNADSETSASKINSDESTPEINFHHDFNPQEAMSHRLVGTFKDEDNRPYPVEITFSTLGAEVSNVIYKNKSVGVSLPLRCTEFDNNMIRFEGKDGDNDFYISLKNIYDDGFEGNAKVGEKEFKVFFDASCNHTS